MATHFEYKNIDPKLVVNEIRNGRSIESVQKIFGIKMKSEVQDLYLRGLMDMGEIPRVAFGNHVPMNSRPASPKVDVEFRPAPPAQPPVIIRTPNLRTIGHSGSITLNKALLIEQMGFTVGDSFEIYREDDRIVLQLKP
jgi:hypothetical protein